MSKTSFSRSWRLVCDSTERRRRSKLKKISTRHERRVINQLIEKEDFEAIGGTPPKVTSYDVI
jgi:hypothetical protein